MSKYELLKNELTIGQPVKIIVEKKNMDGIVIGQIDDNNFLIRTINENFEDPRLKNSIYEKGFYVLNINNDLFELLFKEENIKKSTKDKSTNIISIGNPSKELQKVSMKSDKSEIIENPSEISTSILEKSIKKPEIVESKQIKPEKQSKSIELINLETKNNNKYPKIIFVNYDINKQEEGKKLASNKLLKESKNKLLIESIEKEKIDNEKKEKGGEFSKIDIYNPKYIEVLNSNPNKYALSYRNLDLFSEREIDKKLEEIGIKRLISLKIQNLDGIIMKPIEACQLYLGLDTNMKTFCNMYLSPVNSEKDRITILRKLEPRLGPPKPLYKAKDEIVVNNFHITVDNIIIDEEYEINEGSKIISWIENNLVMFGGYNTTVFRNFMFADLICFQFKGHIFLSKAGVRNPNVINKNLVNLDILKEKYGYPINDSELIVYMQNIDIPGIENSINKIREDASKLLALEYFICLQPEPRYMIFILKRLVMAWYADLDLITSITKVRILINQYRARRDKEDNIKLGVLPSIMIYLRYGSVNFAKALSKINYYFTNLINTGWKDNSPDYFTKYNNLIYYSNGSPDTKRFFEHLPSSIKMKIYKPFTVNPTAFFKDGYEIISTYPQNYPEIDLLKYQSGFDLRNEKLGFGEALPKIELEREKDITQLKLEKILKHKNK